MPHACDTGPESEIAELLERHRKGHALERAFYRSERVFAHDLENVFCREWMLAGHVSEIPDAGDYLLYEMMNESVIVCRGRDGAVHALANVCRHRGSRVCLEARGHAARFVCPYHAWTYNLDGSLFSARLLDAGQDRSDLGLKRVAVEVFHGLIYVSLADKPAGFAGLRQELDPLVAPFGLERTKIAHRQSYPVEANWKLLVENYNECYHCAPAHPEFSRSHSIHMTAERVEPLNADMASRSKACGIATDHVDRIGSRRPQGTPDYAYNRYALLEGYRTGSEDGEPLAPLLGDLTGYDGGASDVYVGIMNPMLVYCDHAVLYRFAPVDRLRSVQEVLWLVHEDAVEGRDYDTEKLIWLWDVTTRADKRIIEQNQEGVNSRFYEPGPFVDMEVHTRRFVEAYLSTLS